MIGWDGGELPDGESILLPKLFTNIKCIDVHGNVCSNMPRWLTLSRYGVLVLSIIILNSMYHVHDNGISNGAIGLSFIYTVASYFLLKIIAIAVWYLITERKVLTQFDWIISSIGILIPIGSWAFFFGIIGFFIRALAVIKGVM
jgi:hypothetical protein